MVNQTVESGLEVKNLSVTRGDRQLISGMNFRVQSGDTVQILGKNGAGKTSLLRVLCGLGVYDEGEIFWNGENLREDPTAFLQSSLYLGHQSGLKSQLTTFENLAIYQKLRGEFDEDAILDALELVGLGAYDDEFVANLSAGQKRRTALARLYLERVKVWVLDEPLVALDVHAQAWLQELIVSHTDKGGMAILTSHQPIAGVRNLTEVCIA